MRWLLTVAALACSTLASAEAPRSIKVTAMSEIKVPPDEVVLQLAVHTRDKQLVAAKRENDKIAAAILSLATKHEVPAADVKVTNLDVSPYYGEYGVRQPTPLAYDFTRSIEFRLAEFKKIEPLLSAAFDAGLSHVTGLQFRVSNQRHHQFEARKLAIAHAKEKAEHLTKLTGMKLGLPIRIEEDVEDNWDAGGFGGMMGGSMVSTQPKLDADEQASSQSVITFVALQQVAKDDDHAAMLAAPGQIVISARVTVEFEMSK
ncbi:MAG: SIMPL domain-containing protein [Planctomycetales bacterium]|nr:SIMPL domain-containing protein [Planctomycetales bacterium]